MEAAGVTQVNRMGWLVQRWQELVDARFEALVFLPPGVGFLQGASPRFQAVSRDRRPDATFLPIVEGEPFQGPAPDDPREVTRRVISGLILIEDAADHPLVRILLEDRSSLIFQPSDSIECNPSDTECVSGDFDGDGNQDEHCECTNPDGCECDFKPDQGDLGTINLAPDTCYVNDGSGDVFVGGCDGGGGGDGGGSGGPCLNCT